MARFDISALWVMTFGNRGFELDVKPHLYDAIRDASDELGRLLAGRRAQTIGNSSMDAEGVVTMLGFRFSFEEAEYLYPVFVAAATVAESWESLDKRGGRP